MLENFSPSLIKGVVGYTLAGRTTHIHTYQSLPELCPGRTHNQMER